MMRLIFAKHDGKEKEFIFRIPDGAVANKGDMLWVETMRGNDIAIASSDVFIADEDVAVRYGAYLPIKSALGIISKEFYSAVAKRVLNKCMLEYTENDLPF